MKKLIFLFFIITKSFLVFGQNSIHEADIPFPEIIYELPEPLIGEFIMITPMYEENITIFPNNKYIISIDVHSHPYLDWYYGHIVFIDNVWYFSPLWPLYNRLQEIQLLDDGFSYNGLRAIRKENMPVPSNLAENISISRRIAINQYFDNNFYRINFNEIDTNPNNFLVSHSLSINNGIVIITCGVLLEEFYKISGPEIRDIYREVFRDDDFFGVITEFIGFLEIIEENDNGFKGIIRFTTGVPYFYIDDGTAQIEKINDNIIITMIYMHILRKNNMPEGFQFPATLILTF
jgi:hypothetical protein